MTTSSAAKRDAFPDIGAHVDDALRAVRVVLGVIACFVLSAYRPLAGTSSWVSFNAALILTFGTVAGLNLLSKRATEQLGWRWAMQALDVAALIALTVALDEPLAHQAWVLLAIPVVSAGVRHGAAAAFLSWIGGCAGYFGAATFGAIDGTNRVDLLARIPGTLLAVAITVGILARWMREGWEIQQELTDKVAAREHRLGVIERTGHALNNLGADDALELCASQAIALGFEAATVQYLDSGRPPMAIGYAKAISEIPLVTEPHPPGPVSTAWVEGESTRTHSLSMFEPETNSIVTVWSRDVMDSDQVGSFAALVAQTSVAIETTGRLEDLRHTAEHDALTGLANRRNLDHQLDLLTSKVGRIAVAFIDLDDFKSINDKHGHDAGDKVLTTTARRIKAAVGPAGTVARYGGDEFVVVLADVSVDKARDIAQTVLDTTANPITIDDKEMRIGLSIGIAAALTPVAARDLLHAADQAVYEAKSCGKGTIVAAQLEQESLASN